MQSTPTKLFAALAAASALCAALPASADWDGPRGHGHERCEGDRHWDGDRGWNRWNRWDGDRRWDGGWRSEGHWRPYREFDRERVVIRERPVFREYRYYEPPARPVYYRRDPALVIGVSLPPLVFPFR